MAEPQSVVLFSGGRTSGFMVRKLMDMFPDYTERFITIFCNTGKERSETLDFVHEVEVAWNIPIIWLEYHRVLASSIPSGIFPTEARNRNLENIAYKFGAADLRVAYDKLKERTTFVERCLEEYKARFGEINDVQLYKPTVAKGMDVNQQYEFIMSTIKEWRNAYKDSSRVPLKENTVDSSDAST